MRFPRVGSNPASVDFFDSHIVVGAVDRCKNCDSILTLSNDPSGEWSNEGTSIVLLVLTSFRSLASCVNPFTSIVWMAMPLLPIIVTVGSPKFTY